MRIIVGITGASGAVYGLRLLEALHKYDCEVHAVVSKLGWQVLNHECGAGSEAIKPYVHTLYDIQDLSACLASGSFLSDGMVIAPCSMRTLGMIANGIGDNLLTRAADVMIKEGRPLVIVPRETPLSQMHLANMLRLAQAGVKILPACPGFYHRPQTIEQLIDMIAGKICDSLQIKHDLYPRWQGI